VLIVTTFMEDALRVLISFSTQQQSMRIAGWQLPFLHSALPCFSFVVQTSGSFLILIPGNARRAQAGCFILLSWCLFHPFMYRQQTNWEFVLETLTIMGGLTILLSHLMLLSAATNKAAATSLPAKAVGPAVSTTDPAAARAHATQAAGRMLIVAVFLYYAFQQVHGYVQRSLSELSHYNWMTPLVEGARPK